MPSPWSARALRQPRRGERRCACAPAGTIENAAMRSSTRFIVSSWPRRKNIPELVRMLGKQVLASVELRGRAAARRSRTRCPRFCPTHCLRRRTWSTPAAPARRVSVQHARAHTLALARLLYEVLALLSRKKAVIHPRARVPAELLQPRLLARLAAHGLAAQQRRPFVPAGGWAQHLQARATRHLSSRTARPASRAAVPRRSTAPRAPNRHTPRAAAARGAPWQGSNGPCKLYPAPQVHGRGAHTTARTARGAVSGDQADRTAERRADVLLTCSLSAQGPSSGGSSVVRYGATAQRQ